MLKGAVDEPGRESHSATPARGLSAHNWSDLCLFTVILFAPLAVATVHPLSWGVCLGLSLTAWIFALRGAPELPFPHPLVLSLLALSGLAVVLPLCPLPLGLVEFLSPLAAEAWLRGPPGVDTEIRWGTVHRAPGPGRYAVLRWCTAAAFTMACTVRTAQRPWRSRALNWVLISGIISIGVCILQSMLHMDSILGLYQPISPNRGLIRPTFLNENHWTAFLGIILVLTLSEIPRRSSSSLRSTLLTLLAIVTGGMLLIVPSRGGLLGATMGTAVLVGLNALRSSEDSRKMTAQRLLGLLASIGIIALVVSFIISVESKKVDPLTGTAVELMSTEPRLAWLPDTIELILAHPITGVGVGGFLDAFAAFRTGAGRNLVYQPEVLPMKVLSETGLILGAILFLLLLALSLLSLRAANQDPKRIGAAAALCSLFVHEQTDFASHVGGVLLIIIPVLVVAVTPRRPRMAGTGVHLTLAIFVASCAAIVGPSLQHWDLSADLERSGLGPESSINEIESTARTLWAQHPSSFVLAQDMGRRFAAAGAPNEAFLWFNRAMLLAPQHPDPHVMTARLLHGLGASSQALVEYRLALHGTPEYATPALLREILGAYPRTESLVRALPKEHPRLLSQLAELAIWDRDTRADKLAELAFQTNPEDPRAAYVRARTLVHSGKTEEGRNLALQILADLELSDGIEYQLLHILWDSGEHAIAVERLRALLEHSAETLPDAHLTLAKWHYHLGQLELARVALRIARLGPPKTAARSMLLSAKIEEDYRGAAIALGMIREAQILDPSLVEAWIEDARLLLRIGHKEKARARIRQSPPELKQTTAGRALLKTLEMTDVELVPTRSIQTGEHTR